MKNLKEEKYFKLGVTIFLIIAALILFIFMLLNIKELYEVFMVLFKLFTPFMLGFIFAYLLNPAVKLFQRKIFDKLYSKTKLNEEKQKKISRFSSVTLVVLLVISFFILTLSFIIPELLKSIELLIINMPAYLEQTKTYLLNIIENNESLKTIVLNNYEKITKYLLNTANNLVMPKIDEWVMIFSSGIFVAIKTGFNLVMGFVISIYFLYDKENFKAQLKKVMYAFFDKKKVNKIIDEFNNANKVFGGFITSKLTVCLLLATMTFTFLTLFKVPYALLIGLLVGITDIIPYFGPFIGAIPSALIILLQAPDKFWLVVIFLIAIQQVEIYLIEPKLYGMKTGIKSFWVLFAIVVFGGAFGLIGMIAGVPLFAIIYGYASQVLAKKLKTKKLPTKTEDYKEIEKL